jgi:hypothetical protein
MNRSGEDFGSTGDVAMVLLLGLLVGLRDRLAREGFERAADVVADLVEVTDAYFAEL